MTPTATDSPVNRRCCDCASAECQLLGRCVAGDQVAWEELFAAHTPYLANLVRFFLGRHKHDDNVVEELVARVWHAVVDHDARVLRRYDPDLSSSVGRYFAGVACRVVRSHLRVEHLRRTRTVPCGCRAGVECWDSGLEVGLLLNEFAAMLNAKEAAFLEEYLLAPPPLVKINGDNGQLSAANVRQRRRRLRVKLEKFLYDAEFEPNDSDGAQD